MYEAHHESMGCSHDFEYNDLNAMLKCLFFSLRCLPVKCELNKAHFGHERDQAAFDTETPSQYCSEKYVAQITSRSSMRRQLDCSALTKPVLMICTSVSIAVQYQVAHSATGRNGGKAKASTRLVPVRHTFLHEFTKMR